MYFSHSCTALIAHPQWQHSLTYGLSPQEDSELGLQEADELQVRCIGQIAVQGQLETETPKPSQASPGNQGQRGEARCCHMSIKNQAKNDC